MTTWISDDHGNKCSVEYFGAEAAARAALASLRDCENCINCSRCSRCSGCSGCSDCSECAGCWDCSECAGCSYCSDCSECSRCSRCSDCSRCSRCSRCSGCSDCSYCSGCSDCSDCSRCSDCSGCSRVKNASPIETNADPPSVPIVENIHARIYAAASQPGSLEMSDWHTCENTHCRAGWVVTLAGQAGRELEEFYDTALAAMLIYDASDPDYRINPARFYDSNDEALADMKALADKAKGGAE